MFRDLEAGNVPGVINDEPASVEIVKDLPALEVVQQIDTNEQYGFAFSPSNPELREAVNLALRAGGGRRHVRRRSAGVLPGVEVPPEFQPTA